MSPTSDSRPTYLAIADRLRERIAAGEFSPGNQLPTGRELADEYKVAPNTVLSAIRQLRDEGVVYSRQGRGSFVKEGAIDALRAGADPELQLLAAKLDEVMTVVQDLADRVIELERTTQRSKGKRSHE